MKLYSVRQQALIISGVLTILVMLFLFAGLFLEIKVLPLLFFVILFFIVAYIIVFFLLNRFIYSRIEPLYKTITNISSQGGKRPKKEKSPRFSISSLQEEVEELAKNQTDEITRLKDLEKYRKEFVGNVSHELKTPIFNIQGYILTLLEGGIDDPAINKLYLKRTEKSIDRMISIVEDLESITKLESGELKLNREKFDLVKLTEEVFELEQMMAQDHDISLVFQTKHDKPMMVKADKKRIMEVMSNLVTNGIKYGKKNGYVKVTLHEMPEHIVVEVEDDGIGIEKAYLPRIFERFYRVDKSRSREQGGTGLGLSIVKHIIEAHKQTISVQSVIDQGTKFTFTLEKVK